MLDYITMKMPNGDYYNVRVQSSYTNNTVKNFKKTKDIKKNDNKCFLFFQQLLML